MKNQLFTLMMFLSIQILNAQPCKTVKKGMPSAEVLKLSGKPTGIDSLGYDNNPDGSKTIITVWNYGNQRVSFEGDKVEQVIADGKKYDELLTAFKNGEFPANELSKRIENLNKSSCK